MKQPELKVSIASDIINDRMTVEIHEDDRILIEGIIKDTKSVVFRSRDEDKTYTFDEIRSIFAEFIKKMDEVENC